MSVEAFYGIQITDYLVLARSPIHHQPRRGHLSLMGAVATVRMTLAF